MLDTGCFSQRRWLVQLIWIMELFLPLCFCFCIWFCKHITVMSAI
jgi:hypothetical protein